MSYVAAVNANSSLLVVVAVCCFFIIVIVIALQFYLCASCSFLFLLLLVCDFFISPTSPSSLLLQPLQRLWQACNMLLQCFRLHKAKVEILCQTSQAIKI